MIKRRFLTNFFFPTLLSLGETWLIAWFYNNGDKLSYKMGKKMKRQAWNTYYARSLTGWRDKRGRSHVPWIVGHVMEAWARCDTMEQCHRGLFEEECPTAAPIFSICSFDTAFVHGWLFRNWGTIFSRILRAVLLAFTWFLGNRNDSLLQNSGNCRIIFTHLNKFIVERACELDRFFNKITTC